MFIKNISLTIKNVEDLIKLKIEDEIMLDFLGLNIKLTLVINGINEKQD